MNHNLIGFLVLTAVFAFQVLFNIFKVLEIRYTLEKQVKKLMINSIYINIVALGSTFFSIDQLIKGNLLVIIFYIGGSILGKYIGIKLETDAEKTDKRFSIFEYLY